MTVRSIYIGAALATAFLTSVAAHATTITGNYALWAKNSGPTVPTTSFGIGDGNAATTFTLAGGTTVTLSGTQDTSCVVGFDCGAWTNGYTGDAIDTTTNANGVGSTETLTLSPGVSAIGFYVQPDLGLFGGTDTISISLFDGTKISFTGTYSDALPPQFIGIYGGSNITSITVSTATAPDFVLGDIDPVPEPVSMALLGSGLAVLALVRNRARR